MKNNEVATVNGFCVSVYALSDFNFLLASEEDSLAFVYSYMRFLELLPEDTSVCLSVVSRDKKPQELFEKKNDGFGELRMEYEANIGNCSQLCREHYLILSTDAAKRTKEECEAWKEQVDHNVRHIFKRILREVITGDIVPLTVKESLENLFNDYAYHKTVYTENVQLNVLPQSSIHTKAARILYHLSLFKDTVTSIHLTSLNSKERIKNHHQYIKETKTIFHGKFFKAAITHTSFSEDKKHFNKESFEDAKGRFGILGKSMITERFSYNTLLGYEPFKKGQAKTTDLCAALLPFFCKEHDDKCGVYYGRNQLTGRAVIYDHNTAINPNGLICGTPGSGLSFVAKNEIVQSFLKGHKVVILDPYDDYSRITDRFSGKVLRFKLNGNTYINPCDLQLDFENLDANVSDKADFMVSFVESVMARGRECNAIEVNAIHRAVHTMYEGYVRTMKKRHKEGSTETIDRLICPTLVDFYNILLEQNTAESNKIAMAIEIFCIGSRDIFAHRTNVDVDAPIVDYELNGLPEKMREMAVRCCMQDIYSRRAPVSDHPVSVYFEGLKYMLETESSATCLLTMIKRSRYFFGNFTAIAHDVSCILKSGPAHAILNNTPFMVLMNLEPTTRKILQDTFCFSDMEADYLINKPCGTGLIVARGGCVPFALQFSTDSKLYRIFSERFDDFEA